MTTKRSNKLLSSDRTGGSLLQKIFILSVIVAIMIALLPVGGVLAAPARDGGPSENGDFESEWAQKVKNVHFQNVFYNRIQILPADFKEKDELTQAYDLVHRYAFALKGANEVIAKHEGFDEKGNTINVFKAEDSVRALGEYLHTIRAIREKLEEADYPIRLK